MSYGKIIELKEKLRLAEQEQASEKLQQEYESVIKYKGTCFASANFQKVSRSGNQGAIYYEDIYLKDNRIICQERSVSLLLMPAIGKAKTLGRGVNFVRAINERILYPNYVNYNALYELRGAMTWTWNEITLHQFNNIWNVAEQTAQDIIAAFDLFTPEITRADNPRVGDQTRAASLKKTINDLQLDVIDLADYPEVQKIVETCALPLVQDQRFMPRIFARRIFENQIRIWEGFQRNNGALSAWYSRSIEILQQFIANDL